jgi:uncharacterized protein YjiS (DUF1127 family)
MRKILSLLLVPVDCLARWQIRARQRHRLGELEDWALVDMGLTRADVAREIDKPFWMA